MNMSFKLKDYYVCRTSFWLCVSWSFNFIRLLGDHKHKVTECPESASSWGDLNHLRHCDRFFLWGSLGKLGFIAFSFGVLKGKV
jgi:hypothetical protein